ncbi:MAG: hypothetical protein ABI645_02600 [Pseudomonadota bacterium]
MNTSVICRGVQLLPLLLALVCTACASGPRDEGEREPVIVEAPASPEDSEAMEREAAADEGVADAEEAEPEVPPAIAASEPPIAPVVMENLGEVVVAAQRHQVISGQVSEARSLLQDVQLDYVFTGKGKNEVLRGRPVAFALWSEATQEWLVARIEIPRPPVKWKPGKKPLPFTMLTPGIEAHHVKGTGAERLMFAFSRNGEPLKVYGRKFPVFEDSLIKKKKWRAVAENARPIVYLPFTEDTFDMQFVNGGREYLLSTARKAIAELRAAQLPGKAFPGELLADVVPPEVITTLAVIEQTDDADFVENREEAYNEVLNHYGLKLDEAYRYSVSRAAAIGPMQFTDRRGNGTYSMVVRKCGSANINPDFERGATDLLNAMKAAICLFDLELAQMRAEIRLAYHDNMQVLGIFPVAAYNGGPKNVNKLFKVIKKLGVKLEELRPAGEEPEGRKVTCPCLWKEVGDEVRPVSIPKYNNENRWYIEKYQSILGVFEPEGEPAHSG